MLFFYEKYGHGRLYSVTDRCAVRAAGWSSALRQCDRPDPLPVDGHCAEPASNPHTTLALRIKPWCDVEIVTSYGILYDINYYVTLELFYVVMLLF